MVIRLSSNQALKLRMRAQHLAMQPSDETASLPRLVKSLCGLQAQEAPAAALAARVRSHGLLAADVEGARLQERSIVRTWGLRSTLHLLATEDLGWLLPLIGPVFVAAGRRRREELGLHDEVYARSLSILRDLLADRGPSTRAEIVEQLAAHGIRLEGQARPYFLGRAALEGIICMGPERGAEPTYVLLSQWVIHEQIGESLSEIDAYVELTRRYLSTYAPATPKDMAAWSGLPASKINKAWQQLTEDLVDVDIDGASAWLLKSQRAWLDELRPTAPIVRLLPRFDVYLLGYHDRRLSVEPSYARRINAGGGILHPTLLVDGRILGVWKSELKKGELVVRVEPFEQLAPSVLEGLKAEVVALAHFQSMQARLEVERKGSG